MLDNFDSTKFINTMYKQCSYKKIQSKNKYDLMCDECYNATDYCWAEFSLAECKTKNELRFFGNALKTQYTLSIVL